MDVTEENFQSYPVTILDTEFLNDRYYLIDCLVYEDREILHEPLADRLDRMNDMAFILRKPFHKIEFKDDMSFIDLYEKWNHFEDMNIDGLIFTIDRYEAHTCYKWKSHNTVDLRYDIKTGLFYTYENRRISTRDTKSQIPLKNNHIYEVSISSDRKINIIQ